MTKEDFSNIISGVIICGIVLFISGGYHYIHQKEGSNYVRINPILNRHGYNSTGGILCVEISCTTSNMVGIHCRNSFWDMAIKLVSNGGSYICGFYSWVYCWDFLEDFSKGREGKKVHPCYHQGRKTIDSESEGGYFVYPSSFFWLNI